MIGGRSPQPIKQVGMKLKNTVFKYHLYLLLFAVPVWFCFGLSLVVSLKMLVYRGEREKFCEKRNMRWRPSFFNAEKTVHTFVGFLFFEPRKVSLLFCPCCQFLSPIGKGKSGIWRICSMWKKSFSSSSTFAVMVVAVVCLRRLARGETTEFGLFLPRQCPILTQIWRERPLGCSIDDKRCGI